MSSAQIPSGEQSAAGPAAVATGQAGPRGPRPPYYLIQALHSIIGYTLWYCGDGVLTAREMSVLLAMLATPAPALMLFLRLATRAQPFHATSRLQEAYHADGTTKRRMDGDLGSSGSSSDSGDDDGDRDATRRSGQETAAGDDPHFPGLGNSAAEQAAIDIVLSTLAESGLLSRFSLSDVINNSQQASQAAQQQQQQQADRVAGDGNERQTTSDDSGTSLPSIRQLVNTVCRVKDLQEMLPLAGVDIAADARNAPSSVSAAVGGGRGAARRGPLSERVVRGGRGRGDGGSNGGAQNNRRFVGKDLLVDIAVSHARELAFGPWDSVVGDLVRVSPAAVEVLNRVSAIFCLLTGFAPQTTVHGGSTPPPLPATGALLAAVRAAEFPVNLPYVPFVVPLVTELRTRSSQTQGAGEAPSPPTRADPAAANVDLFLIDGHSQHAPPMRFAAFPTRQHLDLCLDAQRIEQRLFFLVEDDGRRGRGTDEYAAEIHRLALEVQQGLKKSDALLTAIAPVHDGTTTRTDEPLFVTDPAAAASQIAADTAAESPRSAGPCLPPVGDVESLFLLRDELAIVAGMSLSSDSPDKASSPTTTAGPGPAAPYEHLHTLLPTTRYLRCVSRLGEAFELLKEHDMAIYFYRLVLTTRIEVRRKWHSDRAKALMVKSRSVVFQPRKRGEWHHRIMVDTNHHKNQGKVAVAHCEAMYGVEQTNTKTTAATRAAFDETTILPNEIRSSIRRADRLAIDRYMKRLYAPPRRWCALPPGLLLTDLREAPLTHIFGKRDVSSREWLHGADDSGRVESVALAWYMKGRGRKEQGWKGVHCEGSWMSALFAMVFHDVLFDVASSPGAAVFLTPFQATPLDMQLPRVFYERRKRLVDDALVKLENMSNKQFATSLEEYLSRHKGEQTDFVSWDLNVIDIALSVPIAALARLFRKLVEQDEGHYIRFSGVPDLCLFRPHLAEQPEAVRAPLRFLLVEVKGPNDRLSDKQWAMNDLLLRCGFAVEVCHVTDEDPTDELAKRGKAGSFGDRLKINTSGSGATLDGDGDFQEQREREEKERRRLNARMKRATEGQSRQRRATPHSPTQV